MKLEEQVCSLELAKKLHKLNVGVGTLGQEAIWHWYWDDIKKAWEVGWYGSDDLIKSSKPVCAAFTTDEIAALLSGTDFRRTSQGNSLSRTAWSFIDGNRAENEQRKPEAVPLTVPRTGYTDMTLPHMVANNVGPDSNRGRGKWIVQAPDYTGRKVHVRRR